MAKKQPFDVLLWHLQGVREGLEDALESYDAASCNLGTLLDACDDCKETAITATTAKCVNSLDDANMDYEEILSKALRNFAAVEAKAKALKKKLAQNQQLQALNKAAAKLGNSCSFRS